MTPASKIIASTTFEIPGHRIVALLGLVRGVVVRSPTIPQGIMGSLKSVLGGQIGAFTQMCEQGRSQALETLLNHASSIGANAVIGVRYDASDLGASFPATEVLCYGTAVVVEKAPPLG